METKPPMPLTVQRVQWIDSPPNPRRRMNVLNYADAELIPYQIIRVPVPQVTEFGRSLDRERITEPPIGPANPPIWRMLAVIAACWLLTGFALVGLFASLRWVLRLMGVGA
ncbi:hypothetical protein [Nitrolancea hollandica]|uniref:Uncharacterized protein n=1 Tax=Nitrolancea hollandica Lb TaxID=1129897 RepID=I4EG03_9BACT|nr:hypothetical protein [Nitrolancea hollandica]CCF83615.1 hypothetical protein NITHO_2510013 [Nitrolancea hollandica Lb]